MKGLCVISGFKEGLFFFKGGVNFESGGCEVSG